MDENVMILPFLDSVRNLIVRSSCPDAQKIAAYADCRLIGTERHLIERHLANCSMCAEQVAFLVKSSALPEDPVPDQLMAKALKLGQPHLNRDAPNWRLAGAGALILLIALTATLQYVRHNNQEPDHAAELSAVSASAAAPPNAAAVPTEVHAPELRGSELSLSPFLFPAPNQTVDSTNLVFQWRQFASAEYYEIELLTDDGSFVWSEKVRKSSVALPKAVHLVKGRTYFIKLSVYDVHGSIEQTKAVGFVAG